MSAAQQQALLLGGVSFAAFVVFLCFLIPSRRTKFSVFAACNLLYVALMFGAVALVDLSGGRAEIMVAVMTELPVVLIVAWVCLALAGGLPFSAPCGAGGAQTLVADDPRLGPTRTTTFGGPCYRRRTRLAPSGHACLCSRAAPVFRVEGFDHGP